MTLKYDEEIAEEFFIKKFYEDTGDKWSQREPARIKDFIKWAIIKDYMKYPDEVIKSVSER